MHQATHYRDLIIIFEGSCIWSQPICLEYIFKIFRHLCRYMLASWWVKFKQYSLYSGDRKIHSLQLEGLHLPTSLKFFSLVYFAHYVFSFASVNAAHFISLDIFWLHNHLSQTSQQSLQIFIGDFFPSIDSWCCKAYSCGIFDKSQLVVIWIPYPKRWLSRWASNLLPTVPFSTTRGFTGSRMIFFSSLIYCRCSCCTLWSCLVGNNNSWLPFYPTAWDLFYHHLYQSSQFEPPAMIVIVVFQYEPGIFSSYEYLKLSPDLHDAHWLELLQC